MSPSLEAVREAAAENGLVARGAFRPGDGDGVPDLADGRRPATVVLLGNAGPDMWAMFSQSPEHGDGAPEPLDRWSARVVGALAARFGASALFPFGGPPWLPFQRWAMRSESVHPSPIGPLIHPRYGLWHAYRGALAFGERLDLPGAGAVPSACERCEERPCLATCPVGALTDGAYDVPACARHLRAAEGRACLEGGCLARRACPEGAEHRYPGAQAAFHMAAFLGARSLRGA